MACLKKRGNSYYAQFYVNGEQRRVCLKTDSLKIAKAKLHKIECQLDQGDQSVLPTKTPLGEAVQQYVDHIKVAKTPGSARRDMDILRVIFGPIISDLDQIGQKTKGRRWKRNAENEKKLKSRRHSLPTIKVTYMEQITTSAVSKFIDSSVKQKGLAPRTANRYREILSRFFNWSMNQGGVRMPSDLNPISKVERYRQNAPNIRFLTRNQIAEQLEALETDVQLQTMVALYIYAGLRREEALWLQLDDINFKASSYGMIRINAKTVDGEHWQPKTKINRAVPVSSALRHYLDQYKPRPSVGNWYFPSPTGYRYNCDNFSRVLRQTNNKAGLVWSCLDFRHTFGSQLAMKGESLYKISKLMGNSPDICRTHYAALIPEELSDSVEFDTKVPNLKYIKMG